MQTEPVNRIAVVTVAVQILKTVCGQQQRRVSSARCALPVSFLDGRLRRKIIISHLQERGKTNDEITKALLSVVLFAQLYF